MKNNLYTANASRPGALFKALPIKRSKMIEIIASLLILLFVYTSINKFMSVNTLKYVLVEYPLIGNHSELVAWALPITEMIIALLLFIPRTRLIGLYGSLILMSSFTLYLVYMLSFTTKLPCTCGGMLQKMTWPQHLIFNIVFTLLSILGIWLSRNSPARNKQRAAKEIVFT